MTATEPGPVTATEPGLVVSRAEWQRLVDRVAELEAAIQRLTGPAEPSRFEPADLIDRGAPPHVVEAAETYYAEIDELLAHLAAHPADRWVAYRGRQRLRFGPTAYALHQELDREFPDQRYSLFGIDEADKYPNDTVV